MLGSIGDKLAFDSSSLSACQNLWQNGQLTDC